MKTEQTTTIEQTTQATQAEPKPHEVWASVGEYTGHNEMASGWAASLVARLVARDPQLQQDLDLDAHDRILGELVCALLGHIAPIERHRLTHLVEAVQEREKSTVNLVAAMGWEAGYAAAVEAYTGAPMVEKKLTAEEWEAVRREAREYLAQHPC
jgi:hypothetical protein